MEIGNNKLCADNYHTYIDLLKTLKMHIIEHISAVISGIQNRQIIVKLYIMLWYAMWQIISLMNF